MLLHSYPMDQATTNYYQEIMRLHRKINSEVPGWSNEVFIAVVGEMHRRCVRFLPRQAVKRVASKVTKRQEEITYACKHFQHYLGGET